MNALDEAKSLGNYMAELREYFHAHPELGLKEYNTCDKIQEELTDAYHQASDQENYLTLIKQIYGNSSELTFDSDKQTLLFTEPVSDTQQLTICLKILYPAESSDSLIQILQWKTDNTASWTPDTSQSVYKGGKS